LVTVEDDGKGMDPMAHRGNGNELPGIGLVGVRERVMRLGGHLQIETQAGKGTQLTIELPLSLETSVPEAGPAPAVRPVVSPDT
jgi:signal transduction histidine kinase